MTANDAPDIANVGIAIIGGGPAGLSAALVAARAGCRVVLVDGGPPRNAAAPALHTFVSRDGILPVDFRRESLDQLSAYPTFTSHRGIVSGVRREGDGWKVSIAEGGSFQAKTVLLATGLVDELPAIPGVKEHWGRGVHHCVFCDGHEHRDQPWAVLVEDEAMIEHLAFFRGWSDRITVFSNGAELSDESRAFLLEHRIALESRQVARIEGSGDGHSLSHVALADGTEVRVDSLWIRPRQTQVPLVRDLGLETGEDNVVARDGFGETSLQGIYVAGDPCAGMAQQALFAAADGMRVAFSMVRTVILGR